MPKAPKVFIVESSRQYDTMFTEAGWTLVGNLYDADLVQFTGGEDVSPFLYGQPKHPTTYSDPRRDLVESGYYSWAQRRNIPMAGICRGGQFLNVMNGGSMYQDVKAHAIHGTHEVKDIITAKKHQVTSTHHQMMKPGKSATWIALGDEAHYIIDHNGAEFFDAGSMNSIEVVHYAPTNSLCFQPHPEFTGAFSTRDYYFELLERYLGLRA